MCRRKCNHKNNVSHCQRHTALLLFSYFCFLIMLRISVYFKNYYHSTQIILCKCKLLKGYSFSVNHLIVRMDPFTITFHNISHSSKKEVVYILDEMTWKNVSKTQLHWGKIWVGSLNCKFSCSSISGRSESIT